MNGILADVNMEGGVNEMLTVWRSADWIDFWSALGLSVVTFADLGLARNAPDREVWQRAQAEQLVLITGNRNDDDPDSLEAAIRDLGMPEHFPVITIANPLRMGGDRPYITRCAIKTLEYLTDIDNYRGTGRLYAP